MPCVVDYFSITAHPMQFYSLGKKKNTISFTSKEKELLNYLVNAPRLFGPSVHSIQHALLTSVTAGEIKVLC